MEREKSSRKDNTRRRLKARGWRGCHVLIGVDGGCAEREKDPRGEIRRVYTSYNKGGGIPHACMYVCV